MSDLTAYLNTTGNMLDFHNNTCRTYHWLVPFFLAAYLLVGNVLLINLLIAIFRYFTDSDIEIHTITFHFFGWHHTDCQQKNRYVQMFYHTRINRATSLKFWYLKWYRFYSTFCNIPLFAAYQPWRKKCFFTRLTSIVRNGYEITNNCSKPPHDTLFHG